ncbi:hypothetical protein LPC10_17505 [Methylorubrum sp. B1-46]|uniref:hypothetical protein n=1 Tax=Methylorubrum TaxID=2282523 RepID=UPI001E5047E0|nr:MULTISPECIES: hypothetical protein [Methylorubrum]MCG5246911.1 hypothetical protein [Methylorubrum extorquens]UGB24730.1 hypothetical protein LPC10_17505 [Methylorubrum sp. B1-46]
MNFAIPTAEPAPEETPRQAAARATADRLAKAAQRAADWRAKKAEEDATFRKRAEIDAAIVDAFLLELWDVDQANERAGKAVTARVGIREVMQRVIKRGEPVLPRAEVVRQLQARLAPNRPNPYGA